MNVSKLLKEIIDSKTAWNLVAGPVYNSAIADSVVGIAEEFMMKVSDPGPGSKILDVGCGAGAATMVLAGRFPDSEVIGVDFSTAQVRAARKALSRKRLPNCSFKPGDAMKLPFADAQFDLVVSIASLKHWPDPERGLREISRALKPGARAFVGEADRDYDPRDLKRFIRSFDAPFWVFRPLLEWFVEKSVFDMSCSATEAERMANEAGFASVRVEKADAWPAFMLELANPGNE